MKQRPLELNEKPSAAAQPASRRLAARWRWYHFYFLLAMFDVVVILLSVYHYHRTLSTYRDSLKRLSTLDETERWLSSIRLAIVELNAPGNDVFSTREVARERARFEEVRVRMRALRQRDSEFGVSLNRVNEHLDGMIANELEIFDIMQTIVERQMPSNAGQEPLNQATTVMASMDRFQAGALVELSRVADSVANRQHQLLIDYGASLERSAAIEKYFFVAIIVMLAGVFWYGRKLQQTHEQLFAEQQRSIRERHQRLAAIGEVSSAVAHGIRNPLAGIISSAQLGMEYGTLDAATRLRLKDILFEGQRLNERVTRLLDFAAVSDRPFEICDVRKIVDDAVEEMKPALTERRIDVVVEHNGALLSVNGDRDSLAQSLIEILSNALDHSPCDESIRVATGADAGNRDHIWIRVDDKGPGIPRAIRPHVFDLFFTSKSEGHGIGLATVKRTIEHHGGQVTIDTTETKGTRVEIRLTAAGREDELQ